MADEDVEVQGKLYRFPLDARTVETDEGFFIKTTAGDWVRMAREAPSPHRHKADVSNPWGCDE